MKPKNKPSRKTQNQFIHQQILGLGPKIIHSIKIALDEGDKIHVRKLVEGLDEYDVAKLIESLDRSQRDDLLEILGDKISPEVFTELNDTLQEQIIDNMNETQIVNIVSELDSDEAVELLEYLDDEEQTSVINQLEPELKSQVKTSLAYPEDSAGRIMSRDFVSMPDSWTVKEAKNFLLKSNDLPEYFYTIFIIDEKLRPVGELALDRLLRAKQAQELIEIMDCEITPISVHTDQEEVAHMFREYDWMSAMVVDVKGRLVGAISVDDIIDIIHEEASEDIMHLSGVEEGDVYKSVFQILKSRSIWLVLNLFATIMAASVVSGFQDVIMAVTTLAVLMPIVASMGGTTGQQTLAVVVRALATRELTSTNTWRMIAKEFCVGLSNGFVFACLIWLVTRLWFPDKEIISLVIAIAMLCNLTLASLAGILIPLTLNKFKVDPAISSGVFLIALTDSGGFFVFLGLAKLMLF